MKIKLVLFSALIAGFAITANAQNDQEEQTISQEEVSEEVVETFHEEFASAESPEWRKEGENYSAEFSLEGKEKEVEFDNKGSIQKIKTTITEDELPEAIQNKLSKDYSGYEYNDFARIEKEGKTKYKVSVEKDGKSEDLMFDSAGKKIKHDKDKMSKDKM